MAVGGAGITKLPVSWGLYPGSPCLRPVIGTGREPSGQTQRGSENEVMKREGGEGLFPEGERERLWNVVASEITHMSIQILTLPPTNSGIFGKWKTYSKFSASTSVKWGL